MNEAKRKVTKELEDRHITILEFHPTERGDLRFLAVDHDRGVDVTGVVSSVRPYHWELDTPDPAGLLGEPTDPS